MRIRVIYSTETFLIKNEGQPGKQYVLSFASLEEAKTTPLPEGYVFAYIPVESGQHVYSAKLGWELHQNE